LENQARLSPDARDTVALQQEVINRLRKQQKVGLILQSRSNGLAVKNPVCLGPGGPNCRPLGPIENAKLDAGLVSRQGHDTTKGINFLHQMPLAHPANRGVTRHLPKGLEAVGQQQGLSTRTGRGKGCLGTGMATTHHNHIKDLRKDHG
jgi:hypothetical protein